MKNLHYKLILVLSLSFIGCKEETESTGEETSNTNEITVTRQQFESSGMKIGTFETLEFPEIVQTTGEIDVPPENRAVINAFVGGYVKRNPLLVGDDVKKGQPLITLENPDYIEIQQQYLEVAEQLKYLKAEFDRQQTLFEEKVTSEKKFLQAESDYRRNMAMYNGLRQKLQMLNISPSLVEQGKITSEITIYSPISGSITAVDVSKGMFVTAQDRIMEIVEKEHMHLELIAFEKDVMQIKKGQEIIFKTPEGNSNSFSGEVYLVGKAIDRQSRTVLIHGHLPDSLVEKLTVGMFVEAGIVTNKTKQQALPEEAVIEQEGFSYVLHLLGEENGNYIFQKKEVRPAATYNGYKAIENTADFEANARFLTNGSFRLIGE
ncbi:efflux RND transporter periplasmic adaptor subunit [Antarcticibacterium flavum]|uniref:Efflux RND transporter periplasmic adaptor subunit n=1 Tax=Antarcticibacterium flavum TaxID=2058175 RepID=A0A5B7X6J6_9FLAO|nr:MULTISPECIES: efflux RND transporter periplasmic adaptor subunit [Antarcticibacterium]MCM4159250.1 efflux transporter periplasmic adaptor subunit [Antarcticibacterium sp. W02-3]QCY71037.1 efflux RND transporter periplasmic adaptor subunit [Antarcticibacterium flavum]